MKIYLIHILVIGVLLPLVAEARSVQISNDAPLNIPNDFFGAPLEGGDTIFILSDRTKGLIFLNYAGTLGKPIVIKNKGGLVSIKDSTTWTGLSFKRCKFIKITGSGSSAHKFGFKLAAKYAGINFSDLCSNCEVEFVEIDHKGFVGIQAKDDFKGKPPIPIPVFEELVIHDCFIQHVSEGMYLGETISPGLEFRHVKIYNNILLNTGREGIQIANMVEDVEIYNNVVIASGRDSLYAQGNNMQIGANSVCDVYNNILIGASQFGLIVFGKGPISIYNNYFENNHGLFLDNRQFINEFAQFNISENVFLHLNSDQVVLNYNEINTFSITNNSYSNSISFYNTNCDTCTNATLSHNQQKELQTLKYFVNEELGFKQSDENSSFYKSLGPQQNLNHTFNSWPFFIDLKDIYVDAGDTISASVIAKVSDGDEIKLWFENLPFFVTSEITESGIAQLYIPTKRDYQGVYEAFAISKEKSQGKELKKRFKIIVRLPENKKPETQVEPFYTFYNLEKNTVLINVHDSDGDDVILSAHNLPSFVKLIQVSESEYKLAVSPSYADYGEYQFTLIADDHYGGLDIQEVKMQIEEKALEMGQVVYRVNFGGPTLQAYPINWENATGNYLGHSAINVHGTGSYAYHGINHTHAPDSLFGPFSYGESDSTELLLRFLCEPQKYNVKLYFSEQENYYNKYGATILNIRINDSVVCENLNVSDGLINAALVKEFTIVTKDSLMDVVLQPVKNPVKINGLEISIYAKELSEHNRVPQFAFPSPFSSHLYLRNAFEEAIEEWELTDLSGKVLVSSKINQSRNLSIIKIGVPILKRGIYLMHVKTAHLMFTQKLIGGY